ncbi:MAG: hypothetical protein ABIH09_04755, partial [Candidatus Omnitrophota bacterium]
DMDKLAEAMEQRQFISDEFELIDVTDGEQVMNFVEYTCKKFLTLEDSQPRITHCDKHKSSQEKHFQGKSLKETNSFSFSIKSEEKKEKYIIDVKFGKDSENQNAIYVEIITKDMKDVTTAFIKEQKTIHKHSEWIGNLENPKKVQVLLPYLMRLLAPEWLQESILDSMLDFSKLDKKSALIFSEKVTFDNGVGALLPKLAKAGIKVGVVAKEKERGKQKEAIDYLNSVELKNEENKIFYAETLSELVSKMKNNTPRFYYFKIDADEEEVLPDNVILVDKLTVRQIIRAIASANGLIDETARKLFDLTKRFAVSV